jgi:hypothetical protein
VPSQQELLQVFDTPDKQYFSAKPSRTDLMQELRKAERPFILYHYGKEWRRIALCGSDYYFPPVIEGKKVPSPVHLDAEGKPIYFEADGIIIDPQGQRGLRTCYGFIRNIRDKNRVIGYGPVPGMSHTDLVMLAVENYGEEGIVWLPGDETDAARKAASKRLYFQTARRQAEDNEASRQQFLRHWNSIASNRGRIPPPPTAVQRKAIEILDEIRKEERGGNEWICPHGCSDWKEFDKYAAHMRTAHGKLVTPPTVDTGGPELRATGLPEAPAYDDESRGEPMPVIEIEPSPMERMKTQAPAIEVEPVKRTSAPIKKGGRK